MGSDTPAMTAQLGFFKEIDGTITGASLHRRSEMLRKITDLFVAGSSDFAGQDISNILTMSSFHSSPKSNSPRGNCSRNVLRGFKMRRRRSFALWRFDDTLNVAGPVPTQIRRSSTTRPLSKLQGQKVRVICSPSRSAHPDEPVTDVLVERGDREVLISVVDNFGASISDSGFSTLVHRSEGDDMLADLVGSRPEIPAPLLGALVAKASLAVRAKLEAAHPEAKAEIRRAVAEAADRVEAQIASPVFDYTAATAAIESLKQSGKLDESALASFAKSGAYAEVTAALAIMCDVPVQFVERAMGRDQSENLVVLAKAIGLSSSTLNEILLLRAKKGFLAQGEIAQRLARFNRLQSGTAQEIVRLHRTRAQINPSMPK